MKKILLLVLSATLAIALVACSRKTGGSSKEQSSVGTQSGANAQASKAETTDVTIEETVLVDEAGVKITAKSLEMDTLFGAQVKLLIENNSGKDLTFQTRNSSVNGYMVETMMSVDVVDGKKANDTMTFIESDLKASGITTIADIDLAFHIFTTKNWETYLDTAQVQIKTSVADTYKYTFDDSGKVVVDQSNIKVVVKGLSEDDSILGPSIVVYIENNSDKGVTVQTRDVSINGFMVDAMLSSDIMPGKKAVDTITLLESDLQKNSITKITDIELYFHVFDFESWEDIIDTEAIKLTF